MEVLTEIINFFIDTEYGKYVLALCFLCRAFVTVAPISLTQRVPDSIMQVISVCALVGNRKADNKGNPL